MRIGAAPISFGVFGDIRLDLSPAELVELIAQTGHQGSELGPPGFFGPLDALPSLFGALAPIGAYVPLHLAEPDEVFEADLDGLRATLEELAAVGGGLLAILADEGSPELIAHPFRGPQAALDERAWSLAARRLAKAADLARKAGAEVSFHPHFATYVQTAEEVDRLMATTDIGLCVDTGHAQIAGIDPIDLLRRHGSRVNHVHIKDVRLDVLARAEAEQERADGPWWNALATPLGDGDVDLRGFLRELAESGYDGWLVIEQDRAPVTAETLPEAVAHQRHNVAWLRAQTDAHP